MAETTGYKSVSVIRASCLKLRRNSITASARYHSLPNVRVCHLSTPRFQSWIGKLLLAQISESQPDKRTISQIMVPKTSSGLKSAIGETQLGPPYSAFTSLQKRCIVACVAIGAVFSPLAVQIYLPALEVLAKDIRISVPKANLTVTIYLVFQGIAPVFVAGFSDYLGRRPAYLFCFLVFIAGNVGLALCKNYATLLSLRMIQVSSRSTSNSYATRKY